MVAISGSFPMWEEILKHNCKFAKYVIARYDSSRKDNPYEYMDVFRALQRIGLKFHLFKSEKKINIYNWREEMLRSVHMLSNEGNSFEYILTPDEDEMLPEGLKLSEKGQYIFEYEMASDGTHQPYTYPLKPHAKAFSYDKGLTYVPYKGFAMIRDRYGKYLPKINYPDPIKHYCFYRKEWVEQKEKSINERYPGMLKRIKGE